MAVNDWIEFLRRVGYDRPEERALDIYYAPALSDEDVDLGVLGDSTHDSPGSTRLEQ